MSNKCACFIRVSTEEQAREGVSLSAQEERLRGYTMMAGLEIIAMIREEGISGKLPLAQRPGGKEILRLIREKQVQHVVALKLDRLWRSAEDALRYTREWDAQGITLHLADLGGTAISTSTAMGKMMLCILSGFSEWERNSLAEKTAMALQHKKRHREAYSPTPYGYQREGDILVPDPQELAVVTRIQAMSTEGASLRQIVRTLNEEGIPSKTGGQWHSSAIWYMLHNDLYQSA